MTRFLVNLHLETDVNDNIKDLITQRDIILWLVRQLRHRRIFARRIRVSKGKQFKKKALNHAEETT